MSEFATPFTVQTQAYRESGALDGRGRPVESWDPPESQGVYGWYVPESVEPGNAEANRVLVTLVLLVPESFSIGPHDKVIVPGYGELHVRGLPQDYNNGPFDWRPGFVVHLGRTDG